MWLDMCDDMSLSRLCVASREVFELPKDCEDERLANGIFLSDIAEVRRGVTSSGFRQTSAMWIKPSMCCVIVGSERTIDIQFLTQEYVSRLEFVDLLNLLAMQSLSKAEVLSRNRVYRKCNVHPKVQMIYPKYHPKYISSYALQVSLLRGRDSNQHVGVYSQ